MIRFFLLRHGIFFFVFVCKYSFGRIPTAPRDSDYIKAVLTRLAITARTTMISPSPTSPRRRESIPKKLAIGSRGLVVFMLTFYRSSGATRALLLAHVGSSYTGWVGEPTAPAPSYAQLGFFFSISTCFSSLLDRC